MAELKRAVSLPMMVLYGLGTILGAGIYVLTGVVTDRAGSFAPLSFMLAAIVAAPTAIAYAELSSRFPRSAGEAVYIDAAFSNDFITRFTGLGVAAIGIVSAATITRGFVGYLDVFVVLPDPVVIIAVVIVLGALAIRGILASVLAAAVVTMIELVGLLMVNGVGFSAAMNAPAIPLWPTGDWLPWSGVLAGAFLAFYAFIGFEDMVNIAEETHDASNSLPKAIIIALAICCVLYGLTAFVATRSVPIEELAMSAAPMALVIERNSTMSPLVISAISLLAVVNGALVQMIMASRVFYGMARMKQIPAWLGEVNERTQTPILATLVTVALVMGLALFFELTVLAEITSSMTLLIFAGVNLALIVVKRRQPETDGMTFHVIIPWFGLVTSLALFAASFIQTQ